MFWIVVSVFIGGLTSLLVSQRYDDATATKTLVGVFLVIAGTILGSMPMQCVGEEKVMKLDVPIPPLLLIGMQGFWGIIFSSLVIVSIG